MSLAPYRGERALVLGASGFVGRWVVRALAGAGAHVVAVTRSSTDDAPPESAERIAADLSAPGAVEAILLGRRPRYLFNLAGYGVDPLERSESDSEAINALLPQRLAVAAATLAATQPLTWVQAGSMAEVGASDTGFGEEQPPAPVTPYGRAKLAGSRALAAACARGPLRGCVGRLFMVYGPGEHPARLLPSLIETARTRTPLDLSSGRQRRDFVYVAEASEALLRLGALDLPGSVVNVASGHAHSVRAFAETAADLLGMPRELLRFGARAANPYDVAEGPVTNARLRALTNWSPALSIAEGIAETIRVVRAES